MLLLRLLGLQPAHSICYSGRMLLLACAQHMLYRAYVITSFVTNVLRLCPFWILEKLPVHYFTGALFQS